MKPRRDPYPVLGELHLNGPGITTDCLQCVQGDVGLAQPGLQLSKDVFKLAQSQQCTLQLVLERRQQNKLVTLKTNIKTVFTIQLVRMVIGEYKKQ